MQDLAWSRWMNATNCTINPTSANYHAPGTSTSLPTTGSLGSATGSPKPVPGGAGKWRYLSLPAHPRSPAVIQKQLEHVDQSQMLLFLFLITDSSRSGKRPIYLSDCGGYTRLRRQPICFSPLQHPAQNCRLVSNPSCSQTGGTHPHVRLRMGGKVPRCVHPIYHSAMKTTGLIGHRCNY
jgi:hypothetical protein